MLFVGGSRRVTLLKCCAGAPCSYCAPSGQGADVVSLLCGCAARFVPMLFVELADAVPLLFGCAARFVFTGSPPSRG
jgi:hypothetical protein